METQKSEIISIGIAVSLFPLLSDLTQYDINPVACGGKDVNCLSRKSVSIHQKTEYLVFCISISFKT